MSSPKDPFASIDPTALEKVAGGASRSSSDQVTAMLTQISSSIKDLASSQKNSSTDPMQMMLIMLMMGGIGGGGGGGVVAAPAPPSAPPVINVDSSVATGGRRGKKGW